MTIAVNVHKMSPEQLLELLNVAQAERDQRYSELKTVYGNYFVDHVGPDLLLRIPVVTARFFRLENDAKYPEGIQPKEFQGHSAVRGVMGSGCPFVAVVVDLLENATDTKVVATAAEILFRYKGMDTNYVSALTARTDKDGKVLNESYFHSAFYRTAVAFDPACLRAILSGQTVKATAGKHYIRLHTFPEGTPKARTATSNGVNIVVE